MTRDILLLRRVRLLTWFFIIGLVISGATAIPLGPEVDWLVQVTGANRAVHSPAPTWAHWLLKVQTALNANTRTFPFLFYGTDWLAFGHFVIGLAFVGALRDPVRNAWLFTFGLLACALVPPYALVFGALRGIPLWWRGIDACFGLFGAVPLWLCRRWTKELENLPSAAQGHRSSPSPQPAPR